MDVSANSSIVRCRQGCSACQQPVYAEYLPSHDRRPHSGSTVVGTLVESSVGVVPDRPLHDSSQKIEKMARLMGFVELPAHAEEKLLHVGLLIAPQASVVGNELFGPLHNLPPKGHQRRVEVVDPKTPCQPMGRDGDRHGGRAAAGLHHPIEARRKVRQDELGDSPLAPLVGERVRGRRTGPGLRFQPADVSVAPSWGTSRLIEPVPSVVPGGF